MSRLECMMLPRNVEFAQWALRGGHSEAQPGVLHAQEEMGACCSTPGGPPAPAGSGGGGAPAPRSPRPTVAPGGATVRSPPGLGGRPGHRRRKSTGWKRVQWSPWLAAGATLHKIQENQRVLADWLDSAGDEDNDDGMCFTSTYEVQELAKRAAGMFCRDPDSADFGAAMRELVSVAPRALASVAGMVDRLVLQDAMSLHLLHLPGSRERWLPSAKVLHDCPCDNPDGAIPATTSAENFLHVPAGATVRLVQPGAAADWLLHPTSLKPQEELRLARYRDDVGLVRTELLDIVLMPAAVQGEARDPILPATPVLTSESSSGQASAILQRFAETLDCNHSSLAEEFNRMDADGDGVLNEHELGQGLARAGITVDRADLVEVMMELDAFDSSGKICVEEFIYRLQQLCPALTAEAAAGDASTKPSEDSKPLPSAQPRPRRASFETLFPRRATLEQTPAAREGVAEGAFVALMEVATMMTAALTAPSSTSAATDGDSHSSSATLFMDELVADSIRAAIQPACMLRQYMPMRVELVKQLGPLAAAAHQCRATQCEALCFDALSALANDPMVAVREACARALPSFALCASARGCTMANTPKVQLVPSPRDSIGRLAYERVGEAYARLAADRKAPPRKSLLRLTQALVARFAAADETLPPPASLLRGWGQSTQTVVELLSTPLDQKSLHEQDDAVALTEATLDACLALLEAAGRARWSEMAMGLHALLASCDDVAAGCDWSAGVIATGVAARLELFAEALGSRSHERCLPGLHGVPEFDAPYSEGSEEEDEKEVKQQHERKGEHEEALLGLSPLEQAFLDGIEDDGADSLRHSTTDGTPSTVTRTQSLLRAVEVCIGKASEPMKVPTDSWKRPHDNFAPALRDRVLCQLPRILWALPPAVLRNRPEWLSAMGSAGDNFLASEKAAAAAAVALAESDEEDRDESQSFDGFAQDTAAESESADQQRLQERELSSRDDRATLIAMHLPAAVLLRAASLRANAAGQDDQLQDVSVGARQCTVDAIVTAWESFHELHVHLANDPVLAVRKSLAASVSRLALAVGAPHAARLATPVLDALVAGPRAPAVRGDKEEEHGSGAPIGLDLEISVSVQVDDGEADMDTSATALPAVEQEVLDALLSGMADLIEATVTPVVPCVADANADVLMGTEATASVATAMNYLRMMASIPAQVFDANDDLAQLAAASPDDQALQRDVATRAMLLGGQQADEMRTSASSWGASPMTAECLAAQLGRCAASYVALQRIGGAMVDGDNGAPLSVGHFAQICRHMLHYSTAARVRKAAAAAAAQMLDVLQQQVTICGSSANIGGVDVEKAQQLVQEHTDALLRHATAHSYWQRLLFVWVCDAALSRLTNDNGNGNGSAAASTPTSAGCHHFVGQPNAVALMHLQRLAGPGEPTCNVREAAVLVSKRQSVVAATAHRRRN